MSSVFGDEEAIKVTPTGMAPATDTAFVVQPGHQSATDAADPYAREDEGFVVHDVDPYAHREWRLERAIRAAVEVAPTSS